MDYDLFYTFKTYVSMIEHFRDLEHYRMGAKVIRNGLPVIERGNPGFRDIQIVRQFVELVMVEEDSILELICEDDAVSTIEALTQDAKKVIMTNGEEIRTKILFK
ncbi:MAG: hypothetical protein ACC656_00530 [Candidatus Heimdallarchaeota archaeon]